MQAALLTESKWYIYMKWPSRYISIRPRNGMIRIYTACEIVEQTITTRSPAARLSDRRSAAQRSIDREKPTTDEYRRGKYFLLYNAEKTLHSSLKLLLTRRIPVIRCEHFIIAFQNAPVAFLDKLMMCFTRYLWTIPLCNLILIDIWIRLKQKIKRKR